MIELVEYSEDFLNSSWKWLNDPEIKKLTMAPVFSQEQQQKWYWKIKDAVDYLIWGVMINKEPAGSCGLKNFTSTEAEYWGYIGEKKFWRKGYGCKMMSLVIKKARILKINRLYLKVNKENIVALNLYKKYGFKIFEINDDIVSMELLL